MSSDAEAEDRVVRQVSPLGDHLVPGPLRRRRAELARVVVREADAVLAAAAHALDRREEEVVVREAEVRREHAALEPLDRDVEALDEDVELVLLGRRARLVDLDPLRAEVDQRLEVRPDDVPRDVERQLAARRRPRPLGRGLRRGGPSLGRWCSSYDQTASVYAPVIGIFRSCFAADWRKENSSLWYGSRERDGAGRGRLRVVLVVERAHRAARLEAVRVGDRPRVHLAALLLAVPDDVDAGRLLEAHAVAGSTSGRSRPGRARPAGGARRAARGRRRRPSRPRRAHARCRSPRAACPRRS